MKTHFAISTLVLTLLAGTAELVVPDHGLANAAEAATDPRQDHDSRLASAMAMSAALARESRKAGVDNASILEKIAVRMKEAEALAADGKFAAARTPLDDASRLARVTIAGLQKPSDLKSGSAALDAERRQGESAITADAARNGYVRRRDSVVALLATGQRIANEKGKAVAELTQAASLLNDAETRAATGQFGEARPALEVAYLLVKNAVRDLRGGEELHADKNFANKADEYRYEQERNNDYQSLIAGVIDGRPDPGWAQAAELARSLRSDAEVTAKAGDFAAALRQIEESTKQLKSVLRRAGFPII